MKYDIITLGSAVVDAFVETKLLKKKGMLHVPAGEKIIMEDLDFHTGGGATNTAASFAKLGLKTGCIAKLGDDQNAERILNELKKLNVKFMGNMSKKIPTGFSVILISKNKSRTILSEKGASETLIYREINLKKLKTRWFYFSSAPGRTLKTQIKLSKYAKKHNIKIAYNPSSYLTNNGPDKLKTILKNTEVLILNKEEAQGLAGKSNTIQNLHELGPEIVCVTDGAKGNTVSNGTQIFITKPRKVKVIERTGAGDAFASGFVAGLIRTNDIKKSIQIGSLNAESVIKIKGAKNGIISWAQAIKNLNKIKVKVS
jgi:ribokinase